MTDISLLALFYRTVTAAAKAWLIIYPILFSSMIGVSLECVAQKYHALKYFSAHFAIDALY